MAFRRNFAALTALALAAVVVPTPSKAQNAPSSAASGPACDRLLARERNKIRSQFDALLAAEMPNVNLGKFNAQFEIAFDAITGHRPISAATAHLIAQLITTPEELNYFVPTDCVPYVRGELGDKLATYGLR